MKFLQVDKIIKGFNELLKKENIMFGYGNDKKNGFDIDSDGDIGIPIGSGMNIDSDGDIGFDLGNGLTIDTDGDIGFKF